MSERDRFYFYQDKWLIGTRSLTPGPKALYIDLIALCHSRDEPAIDELTLRSCLGTYQGHLSSYLAALQLAGKVTSEDRQGVLSYRPKRVQHDLSSDRRSKHYNGVEDGLDRARDPARNARDRLQTLDSKFKTESGDPARASDAEGAARRSPSTQSPKPRCDWPACSCAFRSQCQADRKEVMQHGSERQAPLRTPPDLDNAVPPVTAGGIHTIVTNLAAHLRMPNGSDTDEATMEH